MKDKPVNPDLCAETNEVSVVVTVMLHFNWNLI